MHLVSYMSPGFPHSLFETVGRVLGATVSFVEDRSGPDPDNDPFRSGEADLGWICSTTYAANAFRSADPSVVATGVAWVPVDPSSEGQPRYFSDVVVSARSAAESLDDLRDTTIGCNDPVSLSGYYALRYAVAENGHDPDSFCTYRFTGGHRRSLELVAEGTLQAAAVDSVVRHQAAESDPAVTDLRVITQLGPWPVQPLVARADMAPETITEVATTLLAAAKEEPLQSELEAAGLRSLVAVDPASYGVVAEALDVVELD